jgi:hypothetical protein
MTGPGDSARRRLAAKAASVALLVVEAIGTVLMWVPIPVAWFWVGAQVFRLTGSILADGVVVLAGFLATVIVLMRLLTRVDGVWLALRQKAGSDRREGALNQVVVVSATCGMVAFWVWFHVIENGYVIRFMPTD